MLSRVAENLFWIGRFVERAEATAGILDVHLHLLLDDLWQSEDESCRALLRVMGSEVPQGAEITRADVLSMLAVDRHNPASIAFALGAARENARRAREFVSTELWECLNTTRARMPRKVSDEKVHEFFAWVRERSSLAVGIVESATSRDDVWQFFTLGRSIERATMTARLLSLPTLAEAPGSPWAAILRSVGAHEAYSRSAHEATTGREATEFLLLDRLFPRSVLFAVSRAEDCLGEIEQGAGTSTTTEAGRILSALRSDLETTPIAEILDDVPERALAVQSAMTAASDAVARRYFAVDVSPGAVAGR